MAEVRAICFDAFGTLVEISDKRRPFRALLAGQGRGQPPDDPLIRPLSLRDLARKLAITTSEARLLELEQDLASECSSIRLRAGMDRIWSAIRQSNLRIGVCSNLAQPYAEPFLAQLPDIPDVIILSFEAGLLKPQPGIFHLVCARFGLPAEQILFVGDTLEADILGPRAIGMPAMSIADLEAALSGQSSGSSLAETPSLPIRQLLDRLHQCACS
ncbi:HAD family hydrolase [Boseaceae bacterium BT-24-1]|nr:HAD family hydrolase [Boseaceae bacterium BT-24-1]